MLNKKLLLQLKLKINEFQEGTPMGNEEKKYYLDFFHEVIEDYNKAGMLNKNLLNEELKSILRVYIAFMMKLKNYEESLYYLDLFEDSGWKYRTQALITFRALKYPDVTQKFKITSNKGKTDLKLLDPTLSESSLPDIYPQISNLLEKSLDYIDKNITLTINILIEYFDKTFGLNKFNDLNNIKAFLISIKDDSLFKVLLNQELFSNYINKYISLQDLKDSNEEDNLITQLQNRINLLEDMLKEKDLIIEQLKLNKNTIVEEENLVQESIENLNISIGIIGGKKDERSLDFLKEDKSRAVESGINPNNVAFRYYQAWEKSSRSSIYTIIGQNDIIIIGKNDHIWNDIPAEYNGNTQGIYNFLKNEKDSSGNPLCKFVYNGVPDESSTKRPKLSKSTLRSLIVQGINELVREKFNDLKTME